MAARRRPTKTAYRIIRQRDYRIRVTMDSSVAGYLAYVLNTAATQHRRMAKAPSTNEMTRRHFDGIADLCEDMATRIIES